MKRAGIAIGLMILLPGCGGDSILEQAKEGDLGRRDVAVTLNRLERVPGRNVGAGDGNYVLFHHLLTRCEPYEATAAGTVSPSRIRFVVTAGPGEDCDTGMAGTFGYEASLRVPDEFAAGLGYWHPVWAVHHYRDGRQSDSAEIGAVIYSPAPPNSAPFVTVRGRLEPADATIKTDLVVVYFETSPADSSCTPSPHFQYGESMGTAVSDRGQYETSISRWTAHAAIVCVVGYGYRDWQRIVLTPRAVPVDFSQPDTSVTIDMTLPAGAGSWERRWRP